MKRFMRLPVLALVAVLGGASAASAVTTRSVAAPSNASRPAIGGQAAAGSTVTANPGTWRGSTPITFQYQWLVCGANGNACHDINGAAATTYQVRSSDVGNTIRVRAVATNNSGSGSETSAPTPRVAATPAPPPTGCPKLAAGATAVSVADVGSPARLQIDSFVPSGLITSNTTSFSVRFHVSDTCGQPVSGASVHATAVPFHQMTIPPEAATDGSGWVTLDFGRLAGFPAARNQQLRVMFVRARRPGDPTLAGISTRRLISMGVDLRR